MRSIQACLFCIVAACLVHRAGADDRDAIVQLQGERLTTIAANLNGSGAATYERVGIGSVGREQTTSQHPITFCYLGEKSLCRQFIAGSPSINFESALASADRCYLYEAAVGQSKAIVNLIPWADPVGEADLRRWSFREIARIPFPGDDGVVLPALSKLPETQTALEGSTLQIHLEPTIPKQFRDQVLAQKFDMAFDMANGGMLTEFKSYTKNFNLQSGGASGKGETAENWFELKTSWATKGGFVVPVERSCDSKWVDDGVARSDVRTNIKFTKFVVGGVNKDDVSIDRMGIPVGTMIIDNISQTRWRYFKGSAGVEAFADGPTSAPSVGP
jgi:hypothetical protein